MLLLNQQLREGDVTDETIEAVLAGLADIASDPPRGDEGLSTATSLARLALESPMGLARAEALRAAWACLEEREPRTWRLDDVDLTTFVERTRRIEELMLTVEEPTADERAEFTELITWLSQTRVGPDRVSLAVDIADVVTSRTVEELTDGIALDEEGVVLHTVTLVTLHLAGDPISTVRQQAAASITELDPSIGIEFLRSLVVREIDSLVLIRGLDGLVERAPDYPADELGEVLEVLAAHPDPSVARRAAALATS